jgi:acyl carrier protein
MSDTLIRLKEMVGKQLAMEPEDVELNANWVDDLGADSLDVIELVITIEYEFDIDIEDQYASKIRTVQDALTCIERALKN